MKFYSQFNDLEGGRFISFTDSQIFINGKMINMEQGHDITNVSITKDKVFVLFTIQDGCTFDELPRNNIFIYDFDGNFLCNIGDITGETWPFSAIRINSAKTIKNEPLTDSLTTIDGHEYLVCLTYGNLRFIVDITDMKLIHKDSGRFH